MDGFGVCAALGFCGDSGGGTYLFICIFKVYLIPPVPLQRIRRTPGRHRPQNRPKFIENTLCRPKVLTQHLPKHAVPPQGGQKTASKTRCAALKCLKASSQNTLRPPTEVNHTQEGRSSTRGRGPRGRRGIANMTRDLRAGGVKQSKHTIPMKLYLCLTES